MTRSACNSEQRSGFNGIFIADLLAKWLVLMALSFFALCSARSMAAEREPVVVDVGLYLNNVSAVMLKERKFQADFNVWFRWKGDNINALDAFTVVDGQIDLKEELARKKEGETNYGLYRIVATIYYNFDLSKYPLDDHALKIQIEDKRWKGSEMIYRPDTANSNLSQHVHVPGWSMGHFEASSKLETNPTNYGESSVSKGKESTYSRAMFSVEMRRNGFGNFFKLFSMLFFAGVLSFFAFRIRPDYLDSRLALIVSGIFMAAITASMISSALPESDTFDMAEMLYFVTMGFIFASCLISLYTFKQFVGGKEEVANRISRWMGFALPVLYLFANVLIVTMYHGEL